MTPPEQTEQREAGVHYDAWCFDNARGVAGCDHAVRRGEERTLCGRVVIGGGVRTSYPSSERFDPAANYSCKACVRALGLSLDTEEPTDG